MVVKPEEVTLAPDSISIKWSDGHVGHFEPKYLRLNCQCAGCVEEWTRKKLLDPVIVPPDIQAVDYLDVGKYAIQFLWSDAHYTGIYTFDFLRSICQCDECTASRAKTS